jgi:hypothetical protein
MNSKSLVLVFLFTIFFSVIVNAYRLDGLANGNDIDDLSELNDPYLIQRLQALLANAAASKRGGNGVFKDYSVSDHLLDRRLAMNRRPGLLRLKSSTYPEIF